MTRLLVVLAGIVLAVAGCASILTSLDWDSRMYAVDVASGERHQVGDDGSFYASPAWSPDGGELAVATSTPSSTRIDVIDVAGASRVVVPRAGGVQGIAWSPDGSTLAYVRFSESGEWTVETVRADGTDGRRLARHESSRIPPGGPSWSPDGERIAYTAGRDTFVVAAAGGRPSLLAARAFAPLWSPDGRHVLVVRRRGPFRQEVNDLVAVPVAGGRPDVLASGLSNVGYASWSPDSTRVALTAVDLSRDRRSHLYVAALGSEPVRLPVDDVGSVAWSPGGDTIAVARWGEEVMLVDPEDGSSSTVARVHDTLIHDLAWSPDGSRLVFVANRDPSTSIGY